MTNRSPVALFCFNRSDHTKRTLKALSNNAGASLTDIVVYSDGAKHPSQIEAVEETRRTVREFENSFKSLTLIVRESNYGLAKSIIEGVEEMTSKYGRVIVLEDDLETAPFFLTFMNDVLEKYESVESIAHISGYTYPVEWKENQDGVFFLRIPMCWGWATWRRAWVDFRKAEFKEGVVSQEILKYIDFDGAADFSNQHSLNRAGKIDTWFIYWYLSLATHRKLAVFPRRSLVRNIGMDASGTHKVRSGSYEVSLARTQVEVPSPVGMKISESADAIDSHVRYFTALSHRGVRARIRQMLNRMLGLKS